MLRLDLICRRGESLSYRFFDDVVHDLDEGESDALGDQPALFSTWLQEQTAWLPEAVHYGGTVIDREMWYLDLLDEVFARASPEPSTDGIEVSPTHQVEIGDQEPSVLLQGTSTWYRPIGRGATRLVSFNPIVGATSGDGQWTFYVQLWSDLLEDRCEAPLEIGSFVQLQGNPQPSIQGRTFRGLIVRVRSERSARSLLDLQPSFSVDTGAVAGLPLSVIASPGVASPDLWLFRNDPSSRPIGEIDPRTLRIRFNSTIDPLLAIEVCWLVDPAVAPILTLSPAVFDPASPMLRLPAIANFLDWRGIIRLYAHTEEMLLARRRFLMSLTVGPQPAREFFTDLDEITLTTARASAETPEVWRELGDDQFQDLSRLLTYDWWGRASQLLEGDTPVPIDEASSSGDPGTTPASELCRVGGRGLLAVLSSRFPSPGGLDYDGIELAFVEFASAQLTFDTESEPALQGQLEPNGVLMFCFMELACQMHALEGGDERKVWRRLMRIFGLASEVFVRTYHTEGGPRRVCAYVPSNNDLGQRSPSEAELKSMRRKWFGSKVKRRFGRLVLSALWQEFQDEPPKRMTSLPDILDDSSS